jgi:hypothetical protein
MVAGTQQPITDQEWLELAKLELVHPVMTEERPADLDKRIPDLKAPDEPGCDADRLTGEYFLG